METDTGNAARQSRMHDDELIDDSMADEALIAVQPHLKIAGIFPPGHRRKNDAEPKTYDWRYGRWEPENSARVSASQRVLPLETALRTRYEDEAMMVRYLVRAPSGAWLARQPRINKAGLEWLEDQGYSVWLATLIIDVDNPGHRHWTPEDVEEFERVRREVALLRTAGIYTTRAGWRIVQPLTRPVPVADAEEVTIGHMRALELQGVKVDYHCQDWTHVFRLPKTVRDGVRSDQEPDLDSMTAIDPTPFYGGGGAQRATRPPGTKRERRTPPADGSEAPASDDEDEPARRKPRVPRRTDAFVDDATLPAHWNVPIDKLGLAVAETVTGNWRKMYLALGGAFLYARVPHEQVPELIFRIATRANSTKPHEHRGWARETCSKHAGSLNVSGLPALRAQWPGVAAAFDVAMARATAARLYAAQQTVVVPPIDEARAMLLQATVGAGATEGVTVISSECGLGKALAIDTPIPTPTGWKTMGDLVAGNLVFDEHGKPCTVTFVTDVMTNHECYDVVFDDGTVITADADHVWATQTCEQRRRFTKKSQAHKNHGLQRGKSAPEEPVAGLVTTREMRNTIRCAVSKSRLEVNHSVAMAHSLDLPDQILPIDPYVLGVWLGDGHSHVARITSADDFIVEELARAGMGVCAGVPKKGSKASEYPLLMYPCDAIPNTRERLKASMTSVLKQMGLLLNKHIPMSYLRASSAQRVALLQGLMDTDGTVAVGGTCEISLCSKQLANDTLELCLTLGIRATMRIDPARIYGKDCGLRHRIGFTPHFPVFRMPRKLERQHSGKGQTARTKKRFVVDVRERPSVPVRCIRVDSPSHLFLASRAFVPTHNSHSGVEAARLRAELAKPGAKRASAGTKTALSYDKNRLAEQWTHALRQRQVPAQRFRSPLSVKDADGAPACKLHEAASLLQHGGQSVHWEVCEGRRSAPCPHKNGCRAYGLFEGDEESLVATGSHALIKRLADFAGGTGLVVIDEPPPLLETASLEPVELREALDDHGFFVERYADAMRPAVQALALWMQDAALYDEDDTGANAVPLLDALATGSAGVDRVGLAVACAAAGVPVQGSAAERVLACVRAALPADARSTAPPMRTQIGLRARHNPPLAARVGRASKVFKLLYEAIAKRADDPTLRQVVRVVERKTGEGRNRVALVTGARADLVAVLGRRGPTVLSDANADLQLPVLKAMLGTPERPFEPRVVTVAAQDSVAVYRAIAPVKIANRKQLLHNGEPIWDAGFVELLRRVVHWMKLDPAAKSACVITYKVFAVAMRATLNPESTLITAEWAKMGQSPASLDEARRKLGPVLTDWGPGWTLGHYGGLRGMNNAMQCDTVVTICDPRMNFDEVRNELAFCGLAPKIALNDRITANAAAELEQAHGRARDVCRETPCRHLHVGEIRPGGVAWLSPEVEILKLPNRPISDVPEMTGEQLLIDRKSLYPPVSQDDLAKLANVSRRTVIRAEKPGARVPPGIVKVMLNLLSER